MPFEKQFYPYALFSHVLLLLPWPKSGDVFYRVKHRVC